LTLIRSHAQQHEGAGAFGLYALGLRQKFKFGVFCAWIENDAARIQTNNIGIIILLSLWIEVKRNGVNIRKFGLTVQYGQTHNFALLHTKRNRRKTMPQQTHGRFKTVSLWIGRGSDYKGFHNSQLVKRSKSRKVKGAACISQCTMKSMYSNSQYGFDDTRIPRMTHGLKGYLFSTFARKTTDCELLIESATTTIAPYRWLNGRPQGSHPTPRLSKTGGVAAKRVVRAVNIQTAILAFW
jgi:hypothetical protein